MLSYMLGWDSDIETNKQLHSNILKWKCIQTLRFKYIRGFLNGIFYKHLKIACILYDGLAYTKLWEILLCIYSRGWCPQPVSKRNIFLTCSLQMAARACATAGSPKLTALQVLVLLWVRSKDLSHVGSGSQDSHMDARGVELCEDWSEIG